MSDNELKEASRNVTDFQPLRLHTSMLNYTNIDNSDNQIQNDESEPSEMNILKLDQN